LTFAINTTLVLVVTFALGDLDLTVRSLLVPLYYLELIVLVLGLSMLLSALFVFFRDLGHIWEILSLVLFYGSAVVFPFAFIWQHSLKLADLVGMNPVAQIIQDLRYSLVVPSLPDNQSMGSYIGALVVVPMVLSVLVFVVGFLVFTKLTPKFAESL
jgi:ABC-2 type transport system permease protein